MSPPLAEVERKKIIFSPDQVQIRSTMRFPRPIPRCSTDRLPLPPFYSLVVLREICIPLNIPLGGEIEVFDPSCLRCRWIFLRSQVALCAPFFFFPGTLAPASFEHTLIPAQQSLLYFTARFPVVPLHPFMATGSTAIPPPLVACKCIRPPFFQHVLFFFLSSPRR